MFVGRQLGPNQSGPWEPLPGMNSRALGLKFFLSVVVLLLLLAVLLLMIIMEDDAVAGIAFYGGVFGVELHSDTVKKMSKQDPVSEVFVGQVAGGGGGWVGSSDGASEILELGNNLTIKKESSLNMLCSTRVGQRI